MALIKCGNCGKDISNKAQFCVHCGYSLDTIKCEDCGQALPANAQFCMNCGCPVESKEVPVKSTDKTDGTGYTVLYSQEETQQQSVDTPTQTVKSKKPTHNKTEIICAVIAIVALAIFVPIAITSFSNNSDSGYSATTDQDAYRGLLRAQDDMGSSFGKSEMDFEIVYSDGNGRAVIRCEALSENAKNWYMNTYGMTVVYYGYEASYDVTEYKYALSNTEEGAKKAMGW